MIKIWPRYDNLKIFAKFDKSEQPGYPLTIAYFETVITWSNLCQILKSQAVLESSHPGLQDSHIRSWIWWSFKGVMKGFPRLLGCWVTRPASVHKHFLLLRYNFNASQLTLLLWIIPSVLDWLTSSINYKLRSILLHFIYVLYLNMKSKDTKISDSLHVKCWIQIKY